MNKSIVLMGAAMALLVSLPNAAAWSVDANANTPFLYCQYIPTPISVDTNDLPVLVDPRVQAYVGSHCSRESVTVSNNNIVFCLGDPTPPNGLFVKVTITHACGTTTLP